MGISEIAQFRQDFVEFKVEMRENTKEIKSILMTMQPKCAVHDEKFFETEKDLEKTNKRIDGLQHMLWSSLILVIAGLVNSIFSLFSLGRR